MRERDFRRENMCSVMVRSIIKQNVELTVLYLSRLLWDLDSDFSWIIFCAGKGLTIA